MVEPGRLVMSSLNLISLVFTLWLFSRRGASRMAVLVAGVMSVSWLVVLHVALASGWVPDSLSAFGFLGAVVAGVGVVGGLLMIRPVRAGVGRLSLADLSMLQGVRVLFGLTFFVQALIGALPRTFGMLDGLTHFAAGALGLAAASALQRGGGVRLAWVANLFGLADIVVVLSSLSLVLLPEIGPGHPMLSAVFLPAPFWAMWHLFSLARLGGRSPQRMLSVSGAGALVVAALFASSCKPLILRTVMTTVDPYFHGEAVDRIELTQLTARVWTFQWNWYRNLVVSTDEGLVVIDPMGPAAAQALKVALDRQFPAVPVRRVIYSHYHLDHTRGAKVLAPLEVIAHGNCERYWSVLSKDATADLLRPTRTITGDTDLSLGGVELRALDLGLSHTDTLFAFHLPSERVLFTADLGLVKTVAPAGVPDRYAPGYLAALDRLAGLDFEHFVPSHFGFGTKQDLIDWRDMLEFGRTLARRAIERSGSFGLQRSQLGAYFDDIYAPMRERYGSWHGFDEMFILNVVRDLEGEGLGH